MRPRSVRRSRSRARVALVGRTPRSHSRPSWRRWATTSSDLPASAGGLGLSAALLLPCRGLAEWRNCASRNATLPSARSSSGRQIALVHEPSKASASERNQKHDRDSAEIPVTVLLPFQPGSDPNLREVAETAASGPPMAEEVISPMAGSASEQARSAGRRRASARGRLPPTAAARLPYRSVAQAVRFRSSSAEQSAQATSLLWSLSGSTADD